MNLYKYIKIRYSKEAKIRSRRGLHNTDTLAPRDPWGSPYDWDVRRRDAKRDVALFWALIYLLSTLTKIAARDRHWSTSWRIDSQLRVDRR